MVLTSKAAQASLAGLSRLGSKPSSKVQGANGFKYGSNMYLLSKGVCFKAFFLLLRVGLVVPYTFVVVFIME